MIDCCPNCKSRGRFETMLQLWGLIFVCNSCGFEFEWAFEGCDVDAMQPMWSNRKVLDEYRALHPT